MYRLLYNQLNDRMYLPDCTTRSLHRLHVALSINQSISGYRYVMFSCIASCPSLQEKGPAGLPAAFIYEHLLAPD
jgi:hypothetical protein